MSFCQSVVHQIHNALVYALDEYEKQCEEHHTHPYYKWKSGTRVRCDVRVSPIKGPAGIRIATCATAETLYCTDTLLTFEPKLRVVTGAVIARAPLCDLLSSPQETFHRLLTR